MRICLDSNCLRNEMLVVKSVQDVASEDGFVLLPDVLLAEMVKSSDWQSTMKSSLRYLREHADRVIVADAVGPRMCVERDSRKPCTDLFDEELTSRFRRFLDKMDSDENAAIAEIAKGVDAARPDVDARLLTAQALQVNNLGAVSKWKEFLTDAGLKRLRKPDLTAITEILGHEFINDICRLVLISCGFDAENAETLAMGDSVSRRNFLAHEASILRWLAKGGLDMRKDNQIGNDHMDLEVVVAGTYCDENRANDKIVCELDSILRPVVRKVDEGR